MKSSRWRRQDFFFRQKHVIRMKTGLPFFLFSKQSQRRRWFPFFLRCQRIQAILSRQEKWENYSNLSLLLLRVLIRGLLHAEESVKSLRETLLRNLNERPSKLVTSVSCFSESVCSLLVLTVEVEGKASIKGAIFGQSKAIQGNLGQELLELLSKELYEIRVAEAKRLLFISWALFLGFFIEIGLNCRRKIWQWTRVWDCKEDVVFCLFWEMYH